MTHISSVAARPMSSSAPRCGLGWPRVAVAAAALCTLAACKDPEVPNYQSPTIDPQAQSAVQQLISGMFSSTRGSTASGTDLFYYIQAMSSFGRDAGNFTNTDSRYITEWMGAGVAIPNSDFYGGVVWDNLFRVVKTGNTVLADIPTVTPAYSASDAGLVTGIVQTWKAYNFMLLAETRDTNGVPVYGVDMPQGQVAPILCNKDVWAYITALLDSGETALEKGTAGPLPVILPNGFNGASLAGPPGSVGTFAGFNRALRAKAGLEYAYAIARQKGAAAAPSNTSAGSPDVAALTAADAAAKASFIFNGGAVEYVQTTPAPFADPFGVYHSFSGASGDQPNPYFTGLTTMFVVDAADSEIIADPADKRAGKIIPNIAPPGQKTYNAIVSQALTSGNYPSATAPIPIIRNEDLVLIDAAIQLGLGQSANAVTLINAVRTAAGAATVAPAGFVATRNQLLHEFRASNILESGEDRTIMIRNYGVEAQYTTTWGAKDLHTMIEPIPVADNSARNGNITPQCSP
jgi:hypothetical protein